MKRICAILCIFALAFCCCSCTEKSDNAKSDSYAVAEVNGEKIMSDEFEYFKGKLKAEVMNDFLEQYSAEYSEDFWQTDFDGTTPTKELEKRALEECVMAKIQLVLMKDEKIYDDISYKGLYKKAVDFNKANENKSGVVGLKTIQLSQFYTYYIQNGIMELENIYAENKLKADENEINKKAKEIRNKYSEQSEDEVKSIAQRQIETELFDNYIKEMRKKAVIKKY